MPSGLSLAPAADPTNQRIFEQLVKSGVRADRYGLKGLNERVAHILPLPEDAGVTQETEFSDEFVLFYLGANEYSWAAEVNSIRDSEGLVHDFLGDAGIGEDEWDEFSSNYLILDVPFQVEIPSHTLHDQIGIGQEALTRFVEAGEDQLEPLISNHGSVHDYLLTHRTPPTVWVEKTEIEDRPYKQPGGQFELGTSVFSRSASSDGRRIYETLRKAEVGDVVVHLLQDEQKITGVSLVSSTLQEDFSGPPDDSWPEDARGSGYFRPLSRYQPLDQAIDVYDGLLDQPEYGERLQTIIENYDGLFFDRNRDLLEGAYFTRAPLELVYLFIAQSPELVDLLHSHYYDVPFPEAAESYESVNDTVADVRIRLAFTEEGVDWFQEQLAVIVVRTVTETLKKIAPGAEITRNEAAHCELIDTTFQSLEDRLGSLADDLGIGRVNQMSPQKSLFFVLFRELQASAGASANMNHVKLQTILNDNYTVETPRPRLVDPDEIYPLDEPDEPPNAEDIERQLLEIGQMVFYGPPGTGKTFIAQQFAKWWLHQQPDIDPNSSHLETITFHPSFTYEDFLEGLSAKVTQENTVAYEHEPGVFKELADRARQAYDDSPEDESPPKYVLIIDEINRGNLAQIFGETMTALEYDKRLDQPNETRVNLAHTGIPFTIPPNLYLIGTMNTADRSIALVDTALRRRFRFLAFPPNFQALYDDDEFPFDSASEVADVSGDSQDAFERLLALSIQTVQRFNKEIIDAPDLGKGKQIGHSYFFGVEDAEDIVDLWRFEILPLLEEYYFGQFDRIRDDLFAGGGDHLLDFDAEQIEDFSASDLETTLSQLLETES